ncbi:hypothetical protein Tco_0126097 [Tanacetum coccineum]
MSSARFQSTADGSKPEPRITNHSTRSLTVPTGKILASCTSKDDIEPTHGSNGDISSIHECKQTLDSVVAEKADILETSVEVDSKLNRMMTFDHNRSSLEP